MNKADISGRVAARLRLGKAEAEVAVDTVFEAIGGSLAREEAVRIAGFGTFATRSREARMGRNPGTGESVAIPASKAPAFKAARALREVVNRDPKPEAGEQPDDGNRRRWGRPQAGRGLEVSAWPGGIEPVRSMLDAESVRGLGAAPAAVNRALVLANDLSEEELRESAIVRNALILLDAVAGSAFVWLTDKGNLRRETVAAMRSAMSWPWMESIEHFRKGKALREEDVGELHFLHRLLHKAVLVEGDIGLLRLMPLGSKMLEPDNRGMLQALLFRHAFWEMDLSRYVSELPRGLPGWWPQGDIGAVLWSLSAVAKDWQSADARQALCALQDDALPAARWNAAASMFATRILQPLRWFGLMEWREPQEMFEVGCWRKTALFDRFLSFDVRFADGRTNGH